MGIHDDAEYLRPTLDSVLKQEGIEFEFVIVNDGSTDTTGAILASYAEQFPLIRVVEQPNRGLTEALRLGCALARGRYIARQDAADVSLPGRLRLQKEMFDADSSLALVGCWTEYRGPSMEPLYITRDRGKARQPSIVVEREGNRWKLAEVPSHHGAVMFRKSSYEEVGGYRPEFFLAQDQDLWYRMAEAGKYQCLSEVLYVARVLPGGRSLSYRKIQHRLGALADRAFQARRRGESEREILRHASALRPKESPTGAWTRAKAYYFIGEALRRRDDPRCAAYFRKALSITPLHGPSWVRWIQSRAAALV